MEVTKSGNPMSAQECVSNLFYILSRCWMSRFSRNTSLLSWTSLFLDSEIPLPQQPSLLIPLQLLLLLLPLVLVRLLLPLLLLRRGRYFYRPSLHSTSGLTTLHSSYSQIQKSGTRSRLSTYMIYSRSKWFQVLNNCLFLEKWDFTETGSLLQYFHVASQVICWKHYDPSWSRSSPLFLGEATLPLWGLRHM